jgi:SAM-dependent methyltransferase
MNSFWEESEQVERFAVKEPDNRLVQLLQSFDQPQDVRVLDLGCASGRNTVLLAQAGFDFYALDSSEPMIRKTRQRVAAIVGEPPATDRVRTGVMQDLGQFEDGFFRLVVALGIFHQAESTDLWERAVQETSRVLQSDGLLLTASFSPESQPQGEPLRPIPGQAFMYHGFQSGPLCLVDSVKLDRAMAALGMVPQVETATTRVPTDEGFRVTVNGLYRKLPEGSDPDP